VNLAQFIGQKLSNSRLLSVDAPSYEPTACACPSARLASTTRRGDSWPASVRRVRAIGSAAGQDRLAPTRRPRGARSRSSRRSRPRASVPPLPRPGIWSDDHDPVAADAGGASGKWTLVDVVGARLRRFECRCRRDVHAMIRVRASGIGNSHLLRTIALPADGPIRGVDDHAVMTTALSTIARLKRAAIHPAPIQYHWNP
jgi:hypothetical protein